MKTLNVINPLRNTLKHLALASTMGAALYFGASPANAAPPVTNGLRLSLDASALTGLSNGDTVSNWTDMSGNANHAAAASTVNVATYQTNALNGKPVVRFKSNGNASFNFNRVSNIRTVFWVLKNTYPDFRFLLGDSAYADFDPGDAPSYPLWRFSTPAVITNGTTKLMGNVVNGTTTALPSTSYSLLSLVTTGNVRANQLSLDRAYATRSWAGDMAEVLIYDRALTTAEEAFVGSYLANKWGLTTAYPPFQLGVSFTAPANGEIILSGTSVIATADVLDPGAFTPHTVTFHVTPTSPAGPTVSTTDTSAPHTADLGTLAVGTYEIYETIVNSATPVQTATSATRTFTVAPAAPTTTTLTSPATPSTYGQNVTFTATVSPVPTGGTVRFYDGAAALGSPVSVNTTTGVATTSTTTLGAGTHVITAQYSGYNIYNPSTTTGSISQVVGKAPLTVTAQNMVRVPNTANPDPFPYQITGFTNGQTLATSGVTGTPSLTTTAIPSSPVGAYPIACALGSLSASNYSFTLVNGTLIVRASFPVASGLVFHLDASALTGLSNGATVTNWADMSGNNNHTAAAATGSAATYQTNALNGKPVVRFNSNGNASFNFNRVSNIRTVFWVVKNTNPGYHFLLGDSSTHHFVPGSTFIWEPGLSSLTSASILNGTTKLMGNVVNGTTTALPSTSYSLLSLVTAGNVQADRFSYDRGNATRSWTGDMAEVLIYDRALTTAEEAFVGSYLANKYGLTTAYPPFELAVSLTAPANAEGFISGTSVIATASVTDPGAFTPHTVRFHVTPTSPAGPTVVTNSTGTSSPYTADLGTLAVGTYQIYATVANNADPVQTATSATHTFTVESSATWAHSGSMFINTTPAGANLPAGASVSNFPLLVRFNSGNFNFAQAQADGRDIRFSTAAGTALPYEIEQWDATGGKAAVWVKIPTITGNSTQEIIMYWGKSGMSSLSSGSSVFSSSNGYCSVMHLNGNVLDATGSTSPVNGGATPTTAVIGSSAMNLASGNISATNITNFPSGNNPSSTGEVWIRARQIKSGQCLPLAWGNNSNMQIGFLGSSPILPAPLTCRGPATVSGSTALAANQWYHVVYSNSNGTGKLYINGVLDATASGGSLSITNPQAMSLGAAGGDADVDEARISSVVRSADWVTMAYENQKPLQTLVGGIVPAGSDFSVSPTSVTMNETTSTTLTAQAGGAQKVYWIYKKNGQETVLATDQLTFNYTAPRITGNDSAVIQFKAVFAGGVQTIDVPLTVIDTVPDPVFTLVPSTTSWDGRQTMTVTANISNLTALQAAGFGTLNYKWAVSGVAVIKQPTNGTLTLTRSQGSGPLNVSLTIDNGGTPVSQNIVIHVQEPASDPWVERTPGATEKPVNGQFFARDPDTNLGTIFYNGAQSGTPDTVFLKVYRTPNGGSETLEITHRQALVGGAYAFTAPITAGLNTYRVVYGTTTGGVDTDVATVTDLVCGDAFIIEGQSNALATDNSAPNDTTTTNKWVRTYGLTSGWGYAISKGNDRQLGLWGWYLANRLVANHSMPVLIINGAIGGTRIDVHRPNPANHSLPLGAGWGENSYADLYNRIVGAKLTHGIRGLFWHQGEQNQGSGGIDPDYDYKFYQQYFVDISAAWKADFPNLRNYYLFQIWPAACGDTSRNDQLREVQRTLPRLYSNMKIMSTHGIEPGGSCHYVPLGYQVFSDLIGPLVEQDVYGVMPAAKLTAPNLQRAYFTTPAKNEIALVFDQNMAWNPGAPTMLFLANSAGATSGSVSSGSATGNTITLQVSGASSAVAITYLKGLVTWNQANILYGSNGIAALTFADVPIAALGPYGIWANGSFANAFTDKDPSHDPDGDGQSNQDEFAFGLDPTTGSSVNPITQQLDKTTGIFQYTRTKDSGLSYKVYYSTNLSGWILDAAATQSPAAAVAGIETVTVTLAAPAPTDGKLFVRVEATPTP